jgi:glutamate dehydrogenase
MDGFTHGLPGADVDALIAAAAARGFPALAAETPSGVAARSFLEQVAGDAAPEDMQGLTLADLAAAAASLWGFAERRHPDAHDVRLTAAKGADGKRLPRDLLEIVGPDMPFLVDSVMGEIAAQGFEVLAMTHPIVEVRRDGDGARGDEGELRRESFIQVHLKPVARGRRDALIMGVKETLADVRLSVRDFKAMAARMRACAGALAAAAVKADPDLIAESVAFLRWLADDHFVFLGARSYDYARDAGGGLAAEEPLIREELNLGILRDPLRAVLRRANEPMVLSPAARATLEQADPLIVAKSNLRSRVHRRVVMDYVGVKRFSEDGAVIGEDRFVGLFTADAYDQMVRDVPLLRRKVEAVIARAGFAAGGHSDKRFRNLVETYPRDELFQIGEDELLRISLGVMHLYDRPKTKLFIRHDRFGRFVSILAFVPRDRYNSALREKVGEALRAAYGGRLSAYYPLFGDAPLARVHYIIGLDPSVQARPDEAALEAEIARLSRTWDDDLEVVAADDPRRADCAQRYRGAFPAAYREAFDGTEALLDAAEIDALEGDGAVRVRAYRRAEDPADALRCKVYRGAAPAHLSAALPIFENMGLYVESESPYELRRADGAVIWVQDVSMRAADGRAIDFDDAEAAFEEAFAAVWAGRAENDGFNKLVLALGISWREAGLIRALARWRQQSGQDPTQAVQEQALADNPVIARAILDLFAARFDPATGQDCAARAAAASALQAHVADLLNAVQSLDADRVLRRLAALVGAITRTNYYQKDATGQAKDWISFKIASREIAELPNPKPYREIWVWSPRVEGVHLRFGPVARGGLRWSDRRDDFRTEVLDLVKAQQVKNAVIVPVGSKGGFFPKRLPRGGAREAIQAEAVEAYKTFLSGLLDLTDNLDAGGAILPPRDVVRWDDDDPYLVVAADKGTATFSDIANGVSAAYGHWLGDAFASGGSVGYDHKKMGITARGAWEAVKRHFREAGTDIQTTPFTVIGVGDMSGDVFGNGMLFSKATRLIAAFDHRDIFIDPDPDPETSFAERRRLFDLPRSSWQDYDRALISRGGGVFSRAAKAIALSPELKALAGLDQDEATPAELMHALLKAPCDLLYFGGIGTYVKARAETHADAKDKQNDAIRVDAEDLRCRVIGEGANLGMTQRGRIAAARAGVRLNTDAIDNSAGVDSSDHEVNIKILLNGLVRAGAMTEPARNDLLASMTDDVAAHVLAHNYNQTQSITLQEATAAADLDAHERFMDRLEGLGRLDRKVETLPQPDEMRALADQKLGLTRPQLAVLTAYAKIQLFDDLVACDAPDDPFFFSTLRDYFPAGCAPFAEAMGRHRLRREIIATVRANRMVDLGGATFMDRVRESAVADVAAIARAFAAAEAIFGLDRLIDQINALDNAAPAAAQIGLMQEVQAVLRRQTFWLARRTMRGDGPKGVDALIATYGPGVSTLAPQILDVVSPFERARQETRAAGFVASGAPDGLARAIAGLRPLISATDVIDLATSQGWPVASAARLYHAIGAAVGFDELRFAAGQAAAGDHWDRLATRRIIEDFMEEQAALTVSAMSFAQAAGGALAAGADEPDAAWSEALVSAWLTRHETEAGRTETALRDLAASGGWTYAKLAIANAQLREFAFAAGR